jgi:hypothetical protein
MIGPGDELATGGRGRMRAGDADREQVIDSLKAAFVQARLAKDEFDGRVGQAFAARTYADLAAVLEGIPAAPTGAGAPMPRQRTGPPARPSVKKVALSCACAVLAAELVLFVLIIAIPIYLTLDLAVLANLMGLPLAGGMVLDNWRASRGRDQLLPPVRPDPRLTVSASICVSPPPQYRRSAWRA